MVPKKIIVEVSALERISNANSSSGTHLYFYSSKVKNKLIFHNQFNQLIFNKHQTF